MSTRLGELLVRTGLITSEQLKSAEQSLTESGNTLSGKLVELGIVEEKVLLETLSQQYGVPIVELEGYEMAEEIVKLVPRDLAIKHHLVPLVLRDKTLTIAVSDPSNLMALNDVKFITGHDIQVMVSSDQAIKEAHDRVYESKVSYDSIISDFDEHGVEVVEDEQEINVADLARETEDAPVVKLVNAVLTDAVKKGASDIHIEPYERVFRVRFRIDGVLYEIMKPPLKLKNAITSRVKIMASLDIAERRLPQDGRIKLRLGGEREMDYRVNVLPTLFGEKVVLRLLDKGALQLDMTKLGFEPKQLTEFKAAILKPHGMILVTGPTGSGKTTSLYSALAELNKVGTNISTAEDPVEYNLQGINQAQMHDDIGFNFAAALRSFLRQDPDVIMVGEIRDYETAEIAIKASLTGHLVLSTLHTNDAASTINRLLNMGVEPFLVASSVNLILAQRLARRVCADCAEPVELNPEILVNIGIPATEARLVKIVQGKGCQKCSGTGYRGRIALYEVMTMTEEIKDFVLNGASTAEIKREAIRQGMATLRSSALMRLKEGTTTVEEVLRVTAPD